MSDFKILESKINHVDKTLTGIDTTIKHLADKLAETVQQNSLALDNHDTRISSLERSFHVYDGSIKILNRLLAIFGSAIIGGIVWLFVQIHELNKSNALADSKYTYVLQELNDLKLELNELRHDKYTKPSNTD